MEEKEKCMDDCHGDFRPEFSQRTYWNGASGT